MKLGPLPAGALAEAFAWSTPDLIELASLFGGVPGYLQRLDPGRDRLENLRSFVLQRGEPLYEEVPFLLREELREPRVYHSILAVLASGVRKFGELSSKVGLDRANLTRYISVLIDLGLVDREVPVTERHPEKSRKGLYRISDPFVSTWFTRSGTFSRGTCEPPPSTPRSCLGHGRFSRGPLNPSCVSCYAAPRWPASCRSMSRLPAASGAPRPSWTSFFSTASGHRYSSPS